MFKTIVSRFGIPSAFVNFALARTTATFDFGEHSSDQQGKPMGMFSVLGGLAIAITFDSTTRTTHGLLMKMCKHQTEQFITTLQTRGPELCLPMAPTIAWLNVLGQTRARRVIGRRDGIARSEVDIGVHWSKNTQTMKKRLQDLDFRELTRRLTILGSEAAWDAHAIQAHLEIASTCERVQNAIRQGPHGTSSLESESAFAARVKHARQLLRGLQLWTSDNQQRAQVQVQTVRTIKVPHTARELITEQLFSLVSQRDNEINYAAAITSQKIAELSQRDGALMKQIAEDSKEVALRTWRDGVDMRIMAAVTLLTLPGTFTAVSSAQNHASRYFR